MQNKLLDDLALKLTHSSCAIENNTIPYNITKKLLSNQYQLQDFHNNYSTREVNELLNFKSCVSYIFNNYHHLNIENNTILKLHEILMKNIIPDNGVLRKHNVIIQGATVRPYDYSVVDYKLTKVNNEFNDEIKSSKTTLAKEKTILKYHALFEKVHPFSDGNGRTGRALLFLMQLKYDLPIKYIDVKYKQAYFNALEHFHQSGNVDNLYNIYNKTKGKIKWTQNKEITL